MTPHTRPAASAQPATAWYRRALPVAAAVLGVIALAAFVFPSVRTELALSATRQPQPFAELFFTPDDSGRQVVCLRRGMSVLVRFSVTSHFESWHRLAYDVELDPWPRTGRRHRTGVVGLDPGGTARVEKSFRLRPARGYTATVTLPRLGQHIRATCGRPGR